MVRRVLPLLLSAVAAAGITVGVVAWSPWNSSGGETATTVPTPHLTAGEAAGKAESYFHDHSIAEEPARTKSVFGSYYVPEIPPAALARCNVEEHKESTGQWIVQCKFGARDPGPSQRVYVDDGTGEVSLIR